MNYLPTWSDLLLVSREPSRAKPAERASVSAAETAPSPVVTPQPIPNAILHRREVYSVGGHRVTNDSTGWKCECRSLVPNSHCAHVREALRLRAIRQSGK